MTSIEAVSDEPEAWFKLDPDGRKLAVGGSWTIGESARLDRELRRVKPADTVREIDASQISRMDSAGAWLLLRTRRAMEAAGAKVSRFSLPELYQPLFEDLDQERKAEPHKPRIPARLPRPALQDRPRRRAFLTARAFPCWAISAASRSKPAKPSSGPSTICVSPPSSTRSRRPASMPCPSWACSSFLIGVVLAYQGVDQLQALRRRDPHHQRPGHHHPARDGRADHRHHRRRPLRLGLHRPDRHHARQ